MGFFGGGGSVDLSSPPAIGNTTPNTGAFTTLSANNGTITTSSPAFTLAQTWNGSGVSFTALRVNVTDTASSSASYLFDLQVGGATKFRIGKGGVHYLGGHFNLGGSALECYSSEATALARNVSSRVVFFGQESSVGMAMASGYGISWSSNAAGSGDCFLNRDTFILRDAAGTLAQRDGTNAQEKRLYGTYTSTTNYQRMTVKSVKQTISALSGASQTTTGTFIPDGAVVVGVTTRVATLLTGATGYTIGDGTDADRWGDITGTAVGTTSDNRDWTAGTIECFTAGGNITLTAKTSNFTAGAIEICVFYLAGEAD